VLEAGSGASTSCSTTSWDSTSCSTTSWDSTSGTRPRGLDPGDSGASGAPGRPEARPGLVGADDPCPGLLVSVVALPVLRPASGAPVLGLGGLRCLAARLRGSGCPTPTGGGGPTPHPVRLAGTRCTARLDNWAGVADGQRGEEVDRIGPLRAVREHDLRTPPARRQGPPRPRHRGRSCRPGGFVRPGGGHPTSLSRHADMLCVLVAAGSTPRSPSPRLSARVTREPRQVPLTRSVHVTRDSRHVSRDSPDTCQRRLSTRVTDTLRACHETASTRVTDTLCARVTRDSRHVSPEALDRCHETASARVTREHRHVLPETLDTCR